MPFVILFSSRWNKWQLLIYFPHSPVVKHLPAKQEMKVWSLGWEDPLEKEIATYSSILAWKIPQRSLVVTVRGVVKSHTRPYDWVCMHIYKKSLQIPSQMKILYLACRAPSGLVPKSLSSRSLLSTHLSWLPFSFLGHSTTHKHLNSSLSTFCLCTKEGTLWICLLIFPRPPKTWVP